MGQQFNTNITGKTQAITVTSSFIDAFSCHFDSLPCLSLGGSWRQGGVGGPLGNENLWEGRPCCFDVPCSKRGVEKWENHSKTMGK